MKTPTQTAIQILEWLNFDHTRCKDWVAGIADIIRERDESGGMLLTNFTVAGMTLPEILAMRAKVESLRPVVPCSCCSQGDIPFWGYHYVGVGSALKCPRIK